jgi:hypothetical protein
LLRVLGTSQREIGKDIAERKMISQEDEQALRQAIDTFNRGWLG